MYKNKTRAATPRTSMTIAALSILLAACGGGSDGNNAAVSASPNTPASTTTPDSTTTNAANDNTATPAAGTADTSSAATNTPSASNPAASGTAGNADVTSGNSTTAADNTASGTAASARPIEHDSISAELLATLLNEGPDPQGHERLPGNFVLDRWTQVPPAGRPVISHLPDPARVLIGDYVQISQADGSSVTTVHRSIHFGVVTPPEDPYTLNKLSVTIRFLPSIDPATFQPRQAASFAPLAHAAPGTELLRLWPEVEVSGIPGKLKAAQPFPVIKGTRIPVNRTLYQWAADTSTIKLMVIKPAELDNEVRLCLDFALPEVKRPLCSRWTLPENWQLGEEAIRLGNYVVDDRSTVGGQGHDYWHAEDNR